MTAEDVQASRSSAVIDRRYSDFVLSEQHCS
jgi:hypothetical protein